MKAYSLLETLLVIVIISLMAIVSMRVIQIQVTRTKVNTTIAQIQFIGEAAQTFYGLNSYWPDQTDSTMMPLLKNCPWQSQNDSQSCYQIMSNPHENILRFTMTIPSTQANPHSIAAQIAGRLPNAIAQDAQVTIYVPPPIARAGTNTPAPVSSTLRGNQNSGPVVVSIMDFQSNGSTSSTIPSPHGKPITIPPCPDPHMERKVYFSSATYDTEGMQINHSNIAFVQQVLGTCPGVTSLSQTPCDEGSQTPCDVEDILNDPRNNGHLQNPTILPAQAQDPVQLFPYICNVNVTGPGVSPTVTKRVSFSHGLAMTVCDYPS